MTTMDLMALCLFSRDELVAFLVSAGRAANPDLGTVVPVLRLGAHGPFLRASGKPRVAALMQKRADLRDEFSNHSGCLQRLLMIIARVEFLTNKA
uniref:hypothetical protein n=1 Tax=Streptomyces chartreusis TaxID=1969 RepID=UPI003F496CE9